MGEEIITHVNDILTRVRSGLKALKIWEFDNDWVLVYVEEPGIAIGTNFNDPYYLVHKSKNAAMRYSSAEDLDKFLSVVTKTPIWISEVIKDE